MKKMASTGIWKRQECGNLCELPTLLWIPLRGLHFPTFMFLIQDYLKTNVRKILDTTIMGVPSPLKVKGKHRGQVSKINFQGNIHIHFNLSK
jgi:hypothetical protein